MTMKSFVHVTSLSAEPPTSASTHTAAIAIASRKSCPDQ